MLNDLLNKSKIRSTPRVNMISDYPRPVRFVGVRYVQEKSQWGVFLPTLVSSFNGVFLRGGKLLALKDTAVR